MFIFAYALMLSLTLIVFLFAPKQPSSRGNGRIMISSSISFHFNCDSEEFLREALKPSILLEPDNVRQSRPLYGIAGYVVRKFIVRPVRSAVIPDVSVLMPKGIHLREYFVENFDGFFSFLFINFFILWFSLVLFHKTVRYENDYFQPVFLMATLLLSSTLVKTGFWIPHNILFNIMTPLFGLFLCKRIFEQKATTLGSMAGMGILLGILVLFYGSFLLLVPAVVIAIWIAAFRERVLKTHLPTLLINSMVFFSCSIIPFLAWRFLVIHHAGHFYSHEISAYRQVVWILDSMHAGPAPFFNQFRDNLFVFLPLLIKVPFYYYLLLIAVAWYFNLQRKSAPWPMALSTRNAISASLVIGAVMVPGMFLLGFYDYRIIWNIIPLLLVPTTSLVVEIVKNGSLRSKNCIMVLVAGFVIVHFLLVTVSTR